MSDLTMYQAGLGGCTQKVQARSEAEVLAWVSALVGDGHGHHFAVIGDTNTVLLSVNAVSCLRRLGYLQREATDDDLETPAQRRMRALVQADKTETVFPGGVPTQVPRGVCRCPIMRVGDFCPVHGG